MHVDACCEVLGDVCAHVAHFCSHLLAVRCQLQTAGPLNRNFRVALFHFLNNPSTMSTSMSSRVGSTSQSNDYVMMPSFPHSHNIPRTEHLFSSPHLPVHVVVRRYCSLMKRSLSSMTHTPRCACSDRGKAVSPLDIPIACQGEGASASACARKS